MTRIAVFPGQGAQFVGMGRTLHDAFPAARAVFEEVDEALGERLSSVIFDGPIEQLTLTANTQPALMAMSLAAVRALEVATGRTLADLVDYVAGHSLGEYSALAAAGAIRIGDAARLLRLRGQAMQDAVRPGDGAMAAILGADVRDGRGGRGRGHAAGRRLRAGQRQWRRAAGDLGQHEHRRAGHGAGQGAWCAAQRPAAGVGTVPLRADGAGGRAAGRRRSREVEVAPPTVPLIANVTAEPVRDPATIRDLLVRQVTARVRWREIMATMARLGVDDGHRARCRQGADRACQARRARAQVWSTSRSRPTSRRCRCG